MHGQPEHVDQRPVALERRHEHVQAGQPAWRPPDRLPRPRVAGHAGAATLELVHAALIAARSGRRRRLAGCSSQRSASSLSASISRSISASRVGGGHLDAEADLGARAPAGRPRASRRSRGRTGTGRRRRSGSWSASGISMIGNPEWLGVCDAESLEAVEHARRLAPQLGAQLVAARVVDLEAGEHGRQRRDRRRARVQVRRRGHLQHLLERRWGRR